MNREELKTILPHREGMLLLDWAEARDGIAEGVYTVPADALFLQGHFPGNPIVPGVILMEILAQSVCVLLRDKLQAGQLPVYTGMDRVRFHRPVRPGEIVETQCRIKRSMASFYFAEGTVSVDGQLCAAGSFSFALTEA